EMVVRDLAQFLVDKRNQLLKSLPISGSPSDQQFTYGLRGHAHKSLRRRELANDSLAGLPSQSHHHFRSPEFAGVLFGSQFSGPFAGAFPQLLVEGQMAGPWGKPLLDRVESFCDCKPNSEQAPQKTGFAVLSTPEQSKAGPSESCSSDSFLSCSFFMSSRSW